jgi:hypothetical protein
VRVRSLDGVEQNHQADSRAAEGADAQANPRAVQQIGLHEVARLVQLGEIGAATGEEMHVPVLDPGEQQVIRGAARTFDVGK